jgi:hypothetical protein
VLGGIQLWHAERYKPYQQVQYADRTIGDLLEEYYIMIVVEAERLREKAEELDADELDRLSRLEEQLRPSVGDRASLRGLSEEESLELWTTPHYTGDPLTDYWEYRISQDLLSPEELDLGEPPRKDLWNEPWSVIRPEAEMMPKRRPVRHGFTDMKAS